MKPTANAGYDGAIVHSAKPAPDSSGASTSSSRRDVASASAPDGISSAMFVTDQIASSDEISAVDRPVRANSRAYSGYSGMSSPRNA